MTNRINNRDWEALSAYLDGQLSPRDKTRLESRLRDNPILREGLEELRKTRDILRLQPRLRAPRNFTLTPEMAGVKPAHHAYPAFRLAAVLASVLFVVVILGDFLFLGGTGSMQQAAEFLPSSAQLAATASEMSEAEALVEEAGPLAQIVEESPSEVFAIDETVSVEREGDEGEAEVVVEADRAPSAERAQVEGAESAGAGIETPLFAVEPTSTTQPFPEQTIFPPREVPKLIPPPTDTPSLEEALAPEAEEIMLPSSTAEAEGQQPDLISRLSDQITIVRGIEISLVILALGAGLAALLLRRR